MIKTLFKKSYVLYAVAILLMQATFILLGYYTERGNFIQLISCFGILFFLYFVLYKYSNEKDVKNLIYIGILFRVSLFFMVPNLSDDFFRFIWDGKLLQEGISPYLFTPSEYISTHGATDSLKGLYHSMNSPDYYSVYPPFSQIIFYISTLFSTDTNTSIYIMRFLLILCEIGTMFLGRYVLKTNGINAKNILLYALNPLIIIEIVGNLHFEGFMIMFFILSIFLLLKNKILLSALFFSLAVSTKLIPLLFLPLFIKPLGLKKSISFFFYIFLFTVLLALPFLNFTLMEHFLTSVNLYFQTFEFNAGIYYFLREIGMYIYGYNLIQWLGPLLSFLVLIWVVVLSFKSPKKFNVEVIFILFLISIGFYYFTSTTVHPWYLCFLVFISVFTTYRFPIVWSAVVLLSYFAYSNQSYHENLWLIAVEYLIVVLYFIYEVKKKPLFKKNKTAKTNVNKPNE